MQLFLYLLFTSVGAFNLAVVRPFSKTDYSKLINSFNSWNEFSPCHVDDTNSYDLYLSYSQDLNSDYGLEHVYPMVKQIRDMFYNRTQGWTTCFRHLYLHNCRISPEEDIYKPYQYGENYLWVNGPNQQFLSIADLMNKTKVSYQAWYLMEMDSVPRKAGFLSALADEINQEKPFSILGSIYRGDRWDMFMNEIHPFLKNHVNGNAVYNISHPMTQFIINHLKEERNTIYKTIPYDYRISQIIYENIFIHDLKTHSKLFNEGLKQDKKSFYKGHSKVIGNYASTNMLSSLYNSEYIVHGAVNYKQWEKEKIGLVVTDWGNGDLEQFHQIVANGTHPFSEIVYVVPYHILPENRSFYIEGKKGPILIQYKSRDPPNGTSNQDYIDYCYHQPETTNYFMISNTYMRISSPVHLSLEPTTGLPNINYIPVHSSTCQSTRECTDVVKEASSLMGSEAKYMVQDMSMVFMKNYTGSLLTGEKGYCTKWLERYQYRYPYLNTSRCIPKHGPSATGYLAYLGEKRKQHYGFSNVIARGGRETTVPHRIPPDDSHNRYCRDYDPMVARLRRVATTSTNVAMVERRQSTLSNSLINCINIIEDPQKCNSVPYCWWRPVFNKCIQIHETTDTYEQQYRTRLSQTMGESSRYAPPNCPSCNDGSNGSMIAAIVVLGSLVLCLLIPLAILIGLGIMACLKGRTLSGIQRHLSTTRHDVVPSIVPAVVPPPPPPPAGGMVIDQAPVINAMDLPNSARSSNPFGSPRLDGPNPFGSPRVDPPNPFGAPPNLPYPGQLQTPNFIINHNPMI